jgi:hypothetical protein
MRQLCQTLKSIIGSDLALNRRSQRNETLAQEAKFRSRSGNQRGVRSAAARTERVAFCSSGGPYRPRRVDCVVDPRSGKRGLKMAVTGGCLCGAVRFTYDGAIGPAGYCHCADCRRCTGGAYTLSVRLLTSGFEVHCGSLGRYTKTGESGMPLTRHFCSTCGSPIYTSSEHRPEFIHVKAGVLDDPSVVQPAHETWTRSRVVWAKIPSGITSYERGRI